MLKHIIRHDDREEGENQLELIRSSCSVLNQMQRQIDSVLLLIKTKRYDMFVQSTSISLL